MERTNAVKRSEGEKNEEQGGLEESQFGCRHKNAIATHTHQQPKGRGYLDIKSGVIFLTFSQDFSEKFHQLF